MQSGEIVLYAFMSGIEACRRLSADPTDSKDSDHLRDLHGRQA